MTILNNMTHPVSSFNASSFRSLRSHAGRGAHLGVLAFFMMAFCLSGVLSGQEDVAEGQRAFAKKKYPWYDATTDDVKRVEFGKRPEARSKNRQNIPLEQPSNTVAPPGWNWNLNSGWLDGLGVIAWVAIGGLVLVLVAVLIWAFMRMESSRELEDDPAPRRSMSESIKQLPFDIETTTGDFRQLAQQAYTQGDYRTAMIYLFSHVLVSLDQKGLVRLRKGKTNRQYLRELNPHHSLANYYQHVMVPFESTFFGDHELEKREFESCWSQLDGFQTGIENSSQVANV